MWVQAFNMPGTGLSAGSISLDTLQSSLWEDTILAPSLPRGNKSRGHKPGSQVIKKAGIGRQYGAFNHVTSPASFSAQGENSRPSTHCFPGIRGTELASPLTCLILKTSLLFIKIWWTKYSGSNIPFSGFCSWQPRRSERLSPWKETHTAFAQTHSTCCVATHSRPPMHLFYAWRVRTPQTFLPHESKLQESEQHARSSQLHESQGSCMSPSDERTKRPVEFRQQLHSQVQTSACLPHSCLYH